MVPRLDFLELEVPRITPVWPSLVPWTSDRLSLETWTFIVKWNFSRESSLKLLLWRVQPACRKGLLLSFFWNFLGPKLTRLRLENVNFLTCACFKFSKNFRAWSDRKGSANEPNLSKNRFHILNILQWCFEGGKCTFDPYSFERQVWFVKNRFEGRCPPSGNGFRRQTSFKERFSRQIFTFKQWSLKVDPALEQWFLKVL